MTTKQDPVAAALDAVVPPRTSREGRLVQLFGNRPEVLEAVKRARHERKLSYKQIAVALSQSSGDSVSSAAVASWLEKQGKP